MMLSVERRSFDSVLCCLILIISGMFIDVLCLAVVIDHKSTDRLALLVFKDGITQDPLGVLSTWNDSFHYCEWKGVTCSGTHKNRVTKLDLDSYKLAGSISPHVGNLSFLEDLILHNNDLHGEIPEQIGRLFRLKGLGLSNNSLEGEIPHNISHCSNLIHLNLTRNNLVGSVPNELGYLSNLMILRLDDNNLTGEIPTSLGNLSSLTHLYLRINNLEGIIPSTLSQLTSITFLDLGINKLSGMVPPSLYNLSSLTDLSLMNNQLHGSIPFDIGFTLPNLIHLSISDTNFTGTIPSSFTNISRLEVLQLQHNNLVGSVPFNLGELKSLRHINLETNKLGSGQANDLNFINSLINCTNLKTLALAYNDFGGTVPSSIVNFTTNLRVLTLRQNQIYGSIPTGIQSLFGLTQLVIGYNLLTGSIPSSIAKLQNLAILDLEHNKLSGSIPSSFGNLTRMFQLGLGYNNLTGSIPSSLGHCESLQSMELANNRLSGRIPKLIFKLPSLSKFLSLSNNLLTGSLPAEVGNLNNLGILYLSGNKLSGQIPSTIGQCVSLTDLRLDGNLFQGYIPPAISALRSLEILLLSSNNFSGIIPSGIENLTVLKGLNISFNHLEGEVPKGGVFKDRSTFAIEGNSKLCGGIPELKLPKCSVPPKQKQKKSMSTIFILILTAIVALCFTLIVLFLILYWRKKAKGKPKMRSIALDVGSWCMEAYNMLFLTLFERKKSETKLHLTASDVGKQFMEVSYSELHRATNGFNDSTNLLGVGGFGSVYKGILREDTSRPVAVKVLHLEQRGGMKSFMAECDALRKSRHRNLLKIITCCSSVDFQGKDFKALVYKFMANGSLESWLHPAEGDTTNDDQLHMENLNMERRLSIAVDVASALNYIHHDCESPVAHCDLKPSNILLDDDLVAHVGDFGLAKLLPSQSNSSPQVKEQNASSIAIKGSIGYVSPEYGMGGEVSIQGDVYSYGILLLEMFTGKRPTDDMFKDGLNIHNFCKMHALPEKIEQIIDSRLLLDVEGEHYNGNARDIIRQIMSNIIQIGVKCSSELPSGRGKMSGIIVDVEALKNRFHSVGMY